MGRRNNTRSRVAAYIEGYIRGHGFSPTYREIMQGVGLKSLSGVHYHVGMLEEEGVVSVERCAETRNRRAGRIRMCRVMEVEE